MSEYLLEAEELGKEYPGFSLSGLGFGLRRGEVMGLIGPNGAGKTTTIRLLLGLARPDSGRTRLFGADPASAPALRDKLGFVFDEGRFYGSLSARDNAFFLSRVYRAWNDARFRELLKRFGVDPSKKVDELSKGQRTKFALAVAFSHGAELLVLDEPTSGLDPVSRSEILDLLYEFIAEGERGILFSTHITADLEKIADRVTFLRSGRMVFSEETDAALERHALVRGSAVSLDAARELLIGARVTELGFEGLTDRADGLAGIEGLVLERASLEDILVYSTREDYRVRAGA